MQHRHGWGAFGDAGSTSFLFSPPPGPLLQLSTGRVGDGRGTNRDRNHLKVNSGGAV